MKVKSFGIVVTNRHKAFLRLLGGVPREAEVIITSCGAEFQVKGGIAGRDAVTAELIRPSRAWRDRKPTKSATQTRARPIDFAGIEDSPGSRFRIVLLDAACATLFVSGYCPTAGAICELDSGLSLLVHSITEVGGVLGRSALCTVLPVESTTDSAKGLPVDSTTNSAKGRLSVYEQMRDELLKQLGNQNTFSTSLPIDDKSCLNVSISRTSLA